MILLMKFKMMINLELNNYLFTNKTQIRIYYN